jgi:asparagine N-glycosylation enzyme membrane subunit Stt3
LRAPWLDAAIAETNLSTAVSIAILWGLAVFTVTVMLRMSYDYLSGMDAFYHLAVSRFLREEGPYVNGLPWTRMSVFREHWGDRELLFHWLLVPFTYGSLLTGGKWALSLINAGQTAVLAYVSVRWAQSSHSS